MSWLTGSTIPISKLDEKIHEATSEAIPNGGIDLSVSLEITDLIRSKKLPAKQCMRSLKKRLTSVQSNPNLVKLTLQLTDLAVKNGGYHFLLEVASKEFLDFLVDTLLKVHYNVKDDPSVRGNPAKYEVGCYMLQLIKTWSVIFKGQLQLSSVEKEYKKLVHDGYNPLEFAYEGGDITGLGTSGSGIEHLDEMEGLGFEFIDTEVPPDWVDSDECMICYSAFTVLNRKHHCRACGGVFCQTHSSHSIPLVGLGLMDPVRVCDNCYEKVKTKNGHNLKKVKEDNKSKHRDVANGDDDDENLRKAIEMSLQESQVPISRPSIPPPGVAEPDMPQQDDGVDDDEDLKAAIAASLSEYKEKESLYKLQLAPPESSQDDDFYNDLLPQPTPTSVLHQNQYHKPQAQQAIAPLRSQIKAEDLTPQEEESINLFVTLMNNLKNDPSKQANIIYDNNLSELHTKIIKFIPKLNLSLRSSIERYEKFLELSNKISTITRLYDSYLDNKLTQAYSKHSLGDNHPNYQQQISTQLSGYHQSISQNTPYQQPDLTSQSPASQVAMRQHADSSGAQNVSYGYQGHLSQQPSDYRAQLPAHPAYDSISQAENNHQTLAPHSAFQVRTSTGYTRQEPLRDEFSEQNVTSILSSVPPSGYDLGDAPPSSFGPIASPSVGHEIPNAPYPDFAQQDDASLTPSAPPDDEIEVGQLAYPASAGGVPDDENTDKVATKYPSIGEIEQDDHAKFAGDLPSVSHLQPFGSSANPTSKIYTEEPLIEL